MSGNLCSIMRVGLTAVGAFALVLFALCELVMAYPVAWWLYLSAAIGLAGGLIQPIPLRAQLPRVAVVVAMLMLMGVLYFVDWTTRKPFLRDLARLRAGMTEAEVRHIMGHYMEGTGWPAPPFEGSTNNGQLSFAGGDAQYSTTMSASGEMLIRNALVFRHSTNGAFNSDWGIVSLSEGRVVKVEFSPD